MATAFLRALPGLPGALLPPRRSRTHRAGRKGRQHDYRARLSFESSITVNYRVPICSGRGNSPQAARCGPLARHWRHHSRVNHHASLIAIGDAAIVLAPCHLTGICVEVRPGDMVAHTDLSAAKARQETFRLIDASHAVRIADAVVDALGVVRAVQRVPMRSFVGMDCRVGSWKSWRQSASWTLSRISGTSWRGVNLQLCS